MATKYECDKCKNQTPIAEDITDIRITDEGHSHGVRLIQLCSACKQRFELWLAQPKARDFS